MKKIGDATSEEEKEAMKQEMEILLAVKGRDFFKRLESHNTEQASRKGSQAFVIQGFGIVGVSKSKSIKKVRQLLGATISNPDAEKEELAQTILAVEKKYLNNK
jgi:hypothetical protein